MSPENGIPPVSEHERFSDLKIGVGIFRSRYMRLADTITLDYSREDRMLTDLVIKNLICGDGEKQSVPRPHIVFRNDRKDEWVEINHLRRGGYALDVFRVWDEPIFKQIESPEKRLIVWLKEDENRKLSSPFSNTQLLARIRVIPQTLATNSLPLLVPHLYEGTEGASQVITMYPNEAIDPLGKQPSFIAVHDSLYLDDEQNDFVSMNDFTAKSLGQSTSFAEDSVADFWRRLPTFDMYGKSWAAYGLLPNYVYRVD